MKTCNCDLGILREQQFGRKRKYFKISPKQAKFWQIHDPGLYYPNCQILEDLGFSFVVPIPLIEQQQMTVIHTVWPFPPLLWEKKNTQEVPGNSPKTGLGRRLMLSECLLSHIMLLIEDHLRKLAVLIPSKVQDPSTSLPQHQLNLSTV